MASIREAIAQVQELYSKGMPSNDSRLSPRHIYSELITARGTIFKQQNNKNQSANSWTYQQLPCVELIQAPIHECPCAPANGCLILRTKYRIPTPIAGFSGVLIGSITTLNGDLTFDMTTFGDVKYNLGKKYTQFKPSYYDKNGYLYIVYKKQLKAITINDASFDDPIEVYNFSSICTNATSSNCIDLQDMEFPADRDTLRAISQLAANRLIILFSQMREDKTNNSSDDNEVGNQMIHQPNEQE